MFFGLVILAKRAMPYDSMNALIFFFHLLFFYLSITLLEDMGPHAMMLYHLHRRLLRFAIHNA